MHRIRIVGIVVVSLPQVPDTHEVAFPWPGQDIPQVYPIFGPPRIDLKERRHVAKVGIFDGPLSLQGGSGGM
jgi:hypothetical protein